MNFLQLILIAAVVEAVVETLKKIHNFKHDALISLAISIILCFLTKTCILCLFNIDCCIIEVDFIITGILCSRGSNFLHDFLKIIENGKNNLKGFDFGK